MRKGEEAAGRSIPQRRHQLSTLPLSEARVAPRSNSLLQSFDLPHGEEALVYGYVKSISRHVFSLKLDWLR